MSDLRTVETPPAVAAAIAEVNAKWFWGSVVIGLLTMQIVMCIVAAILAVQSEATNILPDYYQKAVQQEEAATVAPQFTNQK